MNTSRLVGAVHRRVRTASLAIAWVHAFLAANCFAMVDTCCPADLNGNGSVDGGDLAMLLGQWNGAGSADLSSNGVVNGADLAILLGAWGACPTGTPPVAPTQISIFGGGCAFTSLDYTFTAVGGSGDTIEWFKDDCAGTPIATGPSLQQFITAPTKYYARWTNACGASACAQTPLIDYITAIAPQSIAAAPGSTICAGQSVTLTAVGGAGLQLRWFRYGDGFNCAPIPICHFAIGPSVVVSPTVTTTYCAFYLGTCGIYNYSSCTPITITVSGPCD